jgi:hypothetical protein
MAGKKPPHILQAVRARVRLSGPCGRLLMATMLDHPNASTWQCLPPSMLDPSNERTFAIERFTQPLHSIAHERSIGAMLDRSGGNASHRTKGAPNGTEGKDGRERRDRRRSQRAERSPGNGRERARNQREDRSRIPPLDVHPSDRGEGYDVGTHVRAGERDDRSLPRAAFARRTERRHERREVASLPGGSVVRGRSPVRSPIGQRSFAGWTTFVVDADNIPPAAPPKGDLTKFSQRVRAKRVDRIFEASLEATYGGTYACAESSTAKVGVCC